jgi:hypothetical protein
MTRRRQDKTIQDETHDNDKTTKAQYKTRHKTHTQHKATQETNTTTQPRLKMTKLKYGHIFLQF